MAKGLYLCAGHARHKNYNIVYNDVDPRSQPDLLKSATRCSLKDYDFFIASPPCNYWSKANITPDKSEYAVKTRHLLPCLIAMLSRQNKPFIIENVKNAPRMSKWGVLQFAMSKGLFIIPYGRHIYITNVLFNPTSKQTRDFKGHYGKVKKYSEVAGGKNVYNVIECWLKTVVNSYK